MSRSTRRRHVGVYFKALIIKLSASVRPSVRPVDQPLEWVNAPHQIINLLRERRIIGWMDGWTDDQSGKVTESNVRFRAGLRELWEVSSAVHGARGIQVGSGGRAGSEGGRVLETRDIVVER